MPSLISAIPPVPNHVSVRQRQSLHFREEKSEAQRSYSLSVTSPALELRFPDSRCSQDRTLFCLQPFPPVPILYFKCPPLQIPSPQASLAVIHMRKGLGVTALFLLALNENGIKKKKSMPFELVRVAGSVSLFPEMFVFCARARKKGGERGMGTGIISKMGCSETWPSHLSIQPLFIEHLLGTVPWVSWGATLLAEGFSGEQGSVSWPHGTGSLIGTCLLLHNMINAGFSVVPRTYCFVLLQKLLALAFKNVIIFKFSSQ